MVTMLLLSGVCLQKCAHVSFIMALAVFVCLPNYVFNSLSTDISASSQACLFLHDFRLLQRVTVVWAHVVSPWLYLLWGNRDSVSAEAAGPHMLPEPVWACRCVPSRSAHDSMHRDLHVHKICLCA